MPQLLASFISIALVGIGLLFYQGQLALALLWVVPIALLFVLISRRLMKKTFVENYHVKRGVSESIQAAIENVQEIKSYNGESAFMNEFENQIKGYEKSLMKTELASGVLRNISYILLKLDCRFVIAERISWHGQRFIDNLLGVLLISGHFLQPYKRSINMYSQHCDLRLDRMREMEQCLYRKENRIFGKELRYCFRQGVVCLRRKKQVLRNVSFTARQGEVMLVGPSGAEAVSVNLQQGFGILIKAP